MKGSQHWAFIGLAELGLGINKHHLKETGWQKMRDARAPQGIDSTGVPPVVVPPQEQCYRGQSVGEASHIKKQATPP